MRRLICAELPRCWMELSERAERFVMTCFGGQNFMVHGSLAADLLDKVVEHAGSDGYHYRCEVAGMVKAKLIVGPPLFS